jgi:hypothetical protein
MIHFLPLEAAAEAPFAGGELAARISGLKRALRLLETSGHGASGDEEDVGPVELSHEGVRRCFDHRSERVIGSAASGLDAVLRVRNEGCDANPAAVDLVAETIREGLASLSELLRR